MIEAQKCAGEGEKPARLIVIFKEIERQSHCEGEDHQAPESSNRPRRDGREDAEGASCEISSL